MRLFKYNIPTLLLLIFFCVVSTPNSFSQSSRFGYGEHINTEGDTLKYRQLISDYDSKSKYPLVVFLHGSGERGEDNESQLKWGVMNFATNDIMKKYRPIVIAPQCPKGMSWGNFSYEDMSLKPMPSKPMSLLIELINKTIEIMPVDSNRIYITGLSMGGFGTFDAISRHPDLFAAAVPVCGGGDISKASAIAHIPIWIFHGSLDDAVPSELSFKMVDALTKAGAHIGYTQYPEAGHFSWIAAYSDTMMMDWMFKKYKKN